MGYRNEPLLCVHAGSLDERDLGGRGRLVNSSRVVLMLESYRYWCLEWTFIRGCSGDQDPEVGVSTGDDGGRERQRC